MRSSYDIDCKGWLTRRSPNTYTLQLMSTTRLEYVHELAGEHRLSGYVVCSYLHEGETRHALLIGDYPSIVAASVAAENLPPGLTTGKPWIRKISDIRRTVAANAP